MDKISYQCVAERLVTNRPDPRAQMRPHLLFFSPMLPNEGGSRTVRAHITPRIVTYPAPRGILFCRI